ncbi:hypothetical protein CERSUDRAFT_88309 [Gelatoporia subvermispora B]|uniref:NAD(P)-binding protein n=1 Tax=Ceriporiopsis subvermispora (strain B) TaxID=914234 RepID=M2R224_CERS8|nr:hypothetical protein CERSUDRAFT_88309 [Gelatoporia subvermispora B]
MPLVWYVTGTSSGLGRELVQILSDRGEMVIATARSLEKIQDSWHRNPRIRLQQLDVTEGVASIKAKVEEAMTFFGRIDVLVNNAGTGVVGLTEEGGSALVREQFDVNFFGQIDVTQAVLPHMRAEKSGTIVFLGSRSSWSPENIVSTGIYGASKGALRILAESLAQEVAPFAIRVLIVEPALVRTNILEGPGWRGTPIPEYDEIKKPSNGKPQKPALPNDPKKVMGAVVDVVTGEGKAKGRPWPLYLPLGPETETTIRKKCATMMEVVEEWKDITRDTRLEDKNLS